MRKVKVSQRHSGKWTAKEPRMGRQHYSPVELEVGRFCQPQPAQLDCLYGLQPTSQVQERSQRQTLSRRGEEKGQLHEVLTVAFKGKGHH